MPTYNNLVSRTDAGALIPEEVSDAMLVNVVNRAAFKMFPVVTANRGAIRFPILSALPTASFVNGDTGLKPTTEVNWTNKFATIEEVAAIVVVPDNVVDDVDYDFWGFVQPLVEQAMAREIDGAIFFGADKPASWPTAIVPAAVAAGNVYARGTNAPNKGGLAEDINQLMGLIEADGFAVDGVIANAATKARLRGTRDANGQPLLTDGQVYGLDTMYPMPGLWPTGTNAAEMVLGDFTEGIVAMRKDVTMTMSREGVITDSNSGIQFNLFQQDMTALRFVMRLGFQVKNSINWEQPVEGQRYPFGVLRSPAS